MARMKTAATKGFTLPEMIPRTISTTSKKTMKAGAKGASIPYEPRRREVTRLVIRHLPGDDEADIEEILPVGCCGTGRWGSILYPPSEPGKQSGRQFPDFRLQLDTESGAHVRRKAASK